MHTEGRVEGLKPRNFRCAPEEPAVAVCGEGSKVISDLSAQRSGFL
jgi:hypothetical protein